MLQQDVNQVVAAVGLNPVGGSGSEVPGVRPFRFEVEAVRAKEVLRVVKGLGVERIHLPIDEGGARRAGRERNDSEESD